MLCWSNQYIGIAIPSYIKIRVIVVWYYRILLWVHIHIDTDSCCMRGIYHSDLVYVRHVLACGVIVIWTICDCSTVLVSHSLPMLILARACMGIGEGVVMPSLHSWWVFSIRKEYACGCNFLWISSGNDTVINALSVDIEDDWRLEANGIIFS